MRYYRDSMDGLFDDAMKWGDDKVSDARKTVTAFVSKMNDLVKIQKDVDKAYASIKDPVAKAKFGAKIKAHRGTFNNYILPAWTKVEPYLPDSLKVTRNPISNSSSAGMGILPLAIPAVIAGVPIATILTVGGVISATGVVAYMKGANTSELELLRDPLVSNAIKEKYLGTSSVLSNVGTITKYAVVGIGVIAASYFAFNFMKARTAIKMLANPRKAISRRQKKDLKKLWTKYDKEESR